MIPSPNAPIINKELNVTFNRSIFVTLVVNDTFLVFRATRAGQEGYFLASKYISIKPDFSQIIALF